MSILITGGAGFIGSNTVRYLNKIGYENIYIVDNLRNNNKYRNLINLKFTDYFEASEFYSLLENGKILTSTLSHCIHLGACSATTEYNSSFLIKNNFGISKTLFHFCNKNEIKFIYASSAATYGDGSQGMEDGNCECNYSPLNPYGFSKLIFDNYLIRNKYINGTTGLKFFNIFGPYEEHKGNMRSVVSSALEKLNYQGHIDLFKSYRKDISHGNQMRDFLFVEDCARIIAFCTFDADEVGLLNVGRGKAITWNNLASSIFKARGMKPDIRYIEMPDNLRGKYQYFTEANISKLRRMGFDADFTPLDVACKTTYETIIH